LSGGRRELTLARFKLGRKQPKNLKLVWGRLLVHADHSKQKTSPFAGSERFKMDGTLE
jgi:hypothetical protein